MAHSLIIIRDDEFDSLIYAEPSVEDLDEEVWHAVMNLIHEAVENEGPRTGLQEISDTFVSWKYHARIGVSFVVVVPEEDVEDSSELTDFMGAVSSHYMSEVSEPRFPETEGLYDVLVDVIAPWDE
jgi:hypothetical protein